MTASPSDDLASAIKAVDEWACSWPCAADADPLILTRRQAQAIVSELAGADQELVIRACFSGTDGTGLDSTGAMPSDSALCVWEWASSSFTGLQHSVCRAVTERHGGR